MEHEGSVVSSEKKAKILEHTGKEIAQQIWLLFQRAYTCEAEVIGFVDFPPLNRTAASIQQSDTSFMGLFEKESLLGVCRV